MRKANLPLPELGMIAGTRAILGAGLALLVADKIPPQMRKRIGWTLFSIGVLSTIPLGCDVFRRVRTEIDPGME